MDTSNRVEDDFGLWLMYFPDGGFNQWMLTDNLGPCGDSFSEQQEATINYNNHTTMQLLHQPNDVAIGNTVLDMDHGSLSPIEEQYTNQPPELSAFVPRFDLVEGNTYTQGHFMSESISPQPFSWPSQETISPPTHSLPLFDFHAGHSHSSTVAQPEYATRLTGQELTQQQESLASLPEQIDRVARRERKRKNPKDLQ